MAEEKAVKKISAKGIMADLRAGLSDIELMKKYDVSYQRASGHILKTYESRPRYRGLFQQESSKTVARPAGGEFDSELAPTVVSLPQLHLLNAPAAN